MQVTAGTMTTTMPSRKAVTDDGVVLSPISSKSIAKKKVMPIRAQWSSVFASTLVMFLRNRKAMMANAMVNLIAIVRNGPIVRIAIVAKSSELALSESASATRNSPRLSFISIWNLFLSVMFFSLISV